MRVEKREILIIYNSRDFRDREALGYAKPMDHHRLKTIDLAKDPLTETQIAQLMSKAPDNLSGLLNTASDLYQDELRDKKPDKEGLVRWIAKNPELLKTPLLLRHDSLEIIESPYDFLKKEFSTSESL